MTYQEFINKWNGKYQERRDSNNKNQCFDLVVGYIIDVYGMKEDTFSGLLHAYQIFTNPTERTGTNFDFIQNNLWTVPRQGDIIVWSSKYGPSGHTAIVHVADVNTITAFSQNDPIGSPCQLRKYNYMNILGFLRRITKSVASSDLESCLKAHKTAVDAANRWEEMYILKEKELDNYKVNVAKTEERLRTEKDQAVREGEQKLAEHKKQCEFEKVEDRKRLINLIIDHVKSLSELK